MNEMCAGALAVSATGRPEPGYCREMLAMLSAMDRHLKDVMQRPVQMVRDSVMVSMSGEGDGVLESRVAFEWFRPISIALR